MKKRKSTRADRPVTTEAVGDVASVEGVPPADAAEPSGGNGIPFDAGSADTDVADTIRVALTEIDVDAEAVTSGGAEPDDASSGDGIPTAPLSGDSGSGDTLPVGRVERADADADADVDVDVDEEGSEGDADGAAEAEGETQGEADAAAGVELGAGADEALPADGPRLESILESLLFAADRPLGLGDLKRLLGERDGKRVTEALDALRARRADSGIQLGSVAGGWQLRTHPANGAWVAKLIAGRPQRLSRAMMETLAIVAYRQPITRPEIDEIRGVDCGPVLRTLLDRGLVRVIGKKEEVGRPILYGTTPEFLKTFSLRDLTELPTLREFHELGAEDRAKVDATNPPADGLGGDASVGSPADLAAAAPLPQVDPAEEDALLEELEEATAAAGRATQSAPAPAAKTDEDESDSPAADGGEL